MSRLLLLLFLYVNYVFCISYNDYSESSASSEEEVAETKKHRLKACVIQFVAKDYPLVLKENSNIVLYPDRHTEVLRIKAFTRVDFVCPGHLNTVLVDEKDTDMKIITATCDPGRNNRDNNFKWSEIRCNKSVLAVARYTGNTCAYKKGKVVSIQFDLGTQRLQEYRLLRVFAICFNERTFIPFYTYNKIDTILRDWHVHSEPKIRKDKAYTSYNLFQMRGFYLRRNERWSINRQLGAHYNTRDYIADDHLHFIIPGCLVSANDYYYEPFRYATYRYFNSAPQWKSVNYYNWKEIEKEVSIYAIQSGYQLEVWTGTDGIITIRNQHEQNNSETEMYLHKRLTVSQFPIPKLIWKIVYRRETKSAIVFISENNPYLDKVKEVCPDVTNRSNWLKFSGRKDITYGYTYACDYHTFKDAIIIVPNIKVTNVLVKDVEGRQMRRIGGPTKRVPYFERTFSPDIEQSYLEFPDINSYDDDIEYDLEPYRKLAQGLVDFERPD